MRSLFARILLWFLATTAVTGLGLIVTRSLNLNAQAGQAPFTRTIPFLLAQARGAYENGGKPALGALLARLRTVYEVNGIFTDSAGRDLLTGDDHSDLIRAAGRKPAFFHLRRNQFIVGRKSDDGKYWFFLPVHYRRLGFWTPLPEDLWVIGAVILLCYWLAKYLTSPVRRLQKAVERFGQGDLSARVDLHRRDELGELAGAFNRMADRIQTLLAAERRLLLDISHELRSPLARLGVAVELARSGGDGGALDRIQKEADRLNSLVGELLQVTRAEGDPSTLRFENVRLGDLVRDIVDTNRIEATARGCELKLEGSADVEIQGEPELLRRAVENVIRNAIRYAPAGSAVEVTLAGTSIRVRDYGPGVPEEDLARIFDPFYRVDSDRNRTSGGVGLGLAIARRAVELHKGAIRAQNAHPGLLVEISLR